MVGLRQELCNNDDGFDYEQSVVVNVIYDETNVAEDRSGWLVTAPATTQPSIVFCGMGRFIPSLICLTNSWS